MKNYILQLLFICLITFSSYSQSKLIGMDWAQGSGDQKLTLDTNANLQWLDVTETVGFSYNDILRDSGGYRGAGFRHAKAFEISTLLFDYGVINSNRCSSICEADENSADHLIDILGGYTVEDWIFKKGLVGFYEGSSINTRVSVGGIVWQLYNKPDVILQMGIGSSTANDFAAEYGHFLVRETIPTPIPAASFLFLPALSGLFIFIKKKKAS